ncbi:MAG: hypothetical protein ACYS8W_03420 [Planctomycetota bacterium]|jgi:hypothetical protein
MAQKPDPKRGQTPDGKPKKKKGNKGVIAILWILTLVAAFICGWQFGPSAAETGGSLVGGAGEAGVKAEIISKLDQAPLDDAQKKAIKDAYAKDDIEKTAMGEAKFKIANKDDKLTKEEWTTIAEAYGYSD